MSGFRILVVLAGLGWLLTSFFPRPVMLVRTLRNARRPDVDAERVRRMAEQLPDDPEVVRREVLERLMPYAYDWDVWHVAYYFPTLSEALAAGSGDCKSQALLLASLLEAKRIPYRLLISLDHIWVDYAGKGPAPMEDTGVAVAEYRDGGYHLLRPVRLRLRSHVDTSVTAYWRAAPRARKILVATGTLFAALLLARARLAGPGAQRQ